MCAGMLAVLVGHCMWAVIHTISVLYCALLYNSCTVCAIGILAVLVGHCMWAIIRAISVLYCALLHVYNTLVLCVLECWRSLYVAVIHSISVTVLCPATVCGPSFIPFLCCTVPCYITLVPCVAGMPEGRPCSLCGQVSL